MKEAPEPEDYEDSESLEPTDTPGGEPVCDEGHEDEWTLPQGVDADESDTQ